jgi:DNA (cytosine-5)-methyltransferase 1
LLYIETIIIENVKEYRDWGPLGANNKPLKSKLGETYRAFINSLRSLGYTVEDRILNAADYGDPTTRERLFIVARRGNKKISWPERTHTPTGAPDLFKKTKKWKSARSIIDWTVPGESIFTRKRPLAPATLARIEAGLRKFGGTAAEPFLVILRNHGGARSLDEPIPTLTAGGNHVGVCEPFVLGQQSCASPRSTKKPLPTIATKGTIALVEPFIVPFFGERNGQKPRTHSLQDPLPTVTSHGAGALVEPFLLTVNHGDEGEKSRARRVHSMEEPVPTMTTKNGLAMIEPFLMNIDHTGGNGVPVRSVDKPVSTQTTKARTALVEPLIVQYQGKSKAHPVDAPLNTITSGNHFGLVEPFLIKYNGTAKARPVDVPLDTVTTKDRFGLIETEHGQVRVDIRFRMLRPDELARAMSFDENYKFTGTKALQVRQIGNAVAVKTAEALCMAALA